jgi:hypothetical protein
MLVVSCSFVLLKLRRKCNGVYLTYFLVDFFVGIKIFIREFSFIIGSESERLKRSILEDLGVGK